MGRSPMQVDEEFRKRLKEIQREIMKRKGEFQSIPNITGEMAKMPELDLMEKKLLGEIEQIEFKINFDRRKKQ